MIFTLTEPATFTTACNPVIINMAGSANPFFASKKQSQFNLPIGKYSTNCQLTKLPFLPFPEIDQNIQPVKTGMRIFDGGSDMAKAVGFNSANKASFYPALNAAFFDEKIITNWFKPARIFTVCHEEGHHYFKPSKVDMAILMMGKDPEAYKRYINAEHKCDVYSYNKMMRNGYNPLQVKQAIKMVLSADNPRVKMLGAAISKINA
jgi:hypothetical protein